MSDINNLNGVIKEMEQQVINIKDFAVVLDKIQVMASHIELLSEKLSEQSQKSIRGELDKFEMKIIHLIDEESKKNRTHRKFQLWMSIGQIILIILILSMAA